MPRINLTAAAIATGLTAAILATGAWAGGSAATTHLTIRHAQKGCHVWSHDGIQSTTLRLDLKAGDSVHVVNRDDVAQQLVQRAGPKLALRGHMMPGRSQLIVFSRPGLYRFENKVITMGQQATVKTTGRESTLRLTVSIR